MKTELAEALRGVEGWFEDEEAWALYEAVRLQPTDGVSAPIVVEIGSWQGRSTVVLASALRARGDGRVYAIDPHSGTALHQATGVEDTYEALLANIRKAGVSDYVEPLRCTSSAARERFAPGSVNVLFVDGAHEYDDVLRDIDEWTSALADKATVAFHDALAYSAVRRAVKDRVLRLGSPFRNPRMVQNTLLADFRRKRLPRLAGRAELARFRAMW